MIDSYFILSLDQYFVKYCRTLRFYTSAYCLTISSFVLENVLERMGAAHIFCRTCYHRLISHQFVVPCTRLPLAYQNTSLHQNHIHIFNRLPLALGNSVELNILFDSAPDQVGNAVEIYLLREKNHHRQHLYVHCSLKIIIPQHKIFEPLDRKSK